MTFRLPSRMLNTGFQYEPVLSMTASVQPVSNNHAFSLSNSGTVVPNRRTSSFGFWWAKPIDTHTMTNFFATSIPAHRSTLTSSMAASSRREADAFFVNLSLGPFSTNRRFVYVGQTNLDSGRSTKLTLRPFLFWALISSVFAPLVKALNIFILGGGPQGHDHLDRCACSGGQPARPHFTRTRQGPFKAIPRVPLSDPV